jgi:aminopeptidase-like protein
MLVSGKELHNFASNIWLFNRSLTGKGVRQTLDAIKSEIPDITVTRFKSGKKVYDWVIPMEWHVNHAYIIDPNGNKICDFEKNNLHLIGYSEPIECDLELEELLEHLHSLPEQPNAIPYITSYYKKRWGFCISEIDKKALPNGIYKVKISATKTPGTLDIGEIYIKGKTKKEILISTYTCHPSMANNEISGITVCTFLAKELMCKKDNNFSYRFLFVPETIGSIAYINKNIKKMRKNIIAGFNLSCIGDDRNFSYLPSRRGNTVSDKAALHVLKLHYPGHKIYSWLDRGSDERQYCAPGVDLPIASLMRTKYGEYPEYHTSLDDLHNVVTATGLEGGFNLVKKVLECIEMNLLPKTQFFCEPMMSKRNLYPTLSKKSENFKSKLMMDIISLSDGINTLLDIANLLGKPINEIFDEAKILAENKVISLSIN